MGSSLLAGLWPVLHFQFGWFESINLPPVWAPIKEAALQSLHSAVASCRLSFLFTTDFVCLSPLSPILGTLWTETQHPPSPEQGLAPALEFQEISKVVSGQQQQASLFAPPSPVQIEGCAPPTQSSCSNPYHRLAWGFSIRAPPSPSRRTSTNPHCLSQLQGGTKMPGHLVQPCSDEA